MNNRVKALRKKLGLSQRKLAEKAETSQQQIQRIETRQVSVRFDLAFRICQALGQPMGVVFPQTREPVATVAGGDVTRLWKPELQEQMEKAGIDMDVFESDLMLRLRGRAEELVLPLEAGERRRLWRALQNIDNDEFVVFDTRDGYRYALNRKQLKCATFLNEPAAPDSTDEEATDVKVWFSDGSELEFEAVMDEKSHFHDAGPLNYFFSMIETDLGGNTVFIFPNSGNDSLFFPSNEIALFGAPSWAIAPMPKFDEDGAVVDEEDEDDEDGEDEDGEDKADDGDEQAEGSEEQRINSVESGGEENPPKSRGGNGGFGSPN